MPPTLHAQAPYTEQYIEAQGEGASAGSPRNQIVANPPTSVSISPSSAPERAVLFTQRTQFAPP